ncbi:hypothetical protein [Nostoc sp.]
MQIRLFVLSSGITAVSTPLPARGGLKDSRLVDKCDRTIGFQHPSRLEVG